MKLLLISSLVALALAQAPSPDLVGGDLQTKTLYYQASIRYHGEHNCSGAVIGRNYILTSANCIFWKRPRDMEVVLGTKWLTLGGTRYDVTRKIVHPNYRPTNQMSTYNIGLLQISSWYCSEASAISLNRQPVRNYELLTVTGWGATMRENHENSHDLRYLDVTALTHRECQATFPEIDSGHMCTVKGKNFGLCHGDEGNPLVDDDDMLVGIAVGHSDPCGDGKPDLYTRISVYHDWIYAVMGYYHDWE